MERYNDLVLAVWREACRHIEVERSLSRIADIIAARVDVQSLCLYCLDAPARRMTRLFFSSAESGAAPPPIVGLGPRAASDLNGWCKANSSAHFPRNHPPDAIPAAVLEGMGEHVAASSLVSEHGTLGVLLVGARTPLEEREQRLLLLLREPLAVALENDRRLHELVTLREAAEADKRRLLHRLGREKLIDEIVGAEGGLRGVMERVALVTRSDVPVLIFGETGSGKELVARAIHQQSSRSEGPFIRVNCGAIPSELIDSELFGHRRGSFTGAVADRRGWFERADGGTLFLDEIGELPPAAQVRLLRVLQDGTFEPVGGEKPLHVNVRIVAATHRDLARMVQEHAFREDLWYRIAVFPVVLPPLRERKEDIPELAAHFAERAARRFGLRPQAPTPEDVALLTQYRWPGNVREFAAVLDRAAILGDGKSLEVAKALGIVPAAHPRDDETSPGEAAELRFLPLDAAMAQHIERALGRCRGKLEGPGGAAELLNINPHTLRARMRKLGIDWRRYRG